MVSKHYELMACLKPPCSQSARQPPSPNHSLPLPLGGALQALVMSIDWRLFCEESASQTITLQISQ